MRDFSAKRIWTLCLGIVAIAGISVSAQAQPSFYDMEKISQIHDYSSELDQTKFLEDSNLHEDMPLGDKHLTYQIRLPKGWEKVEAKTVNFGLENGDETDDDGRIIAKRILGEIARYYGPGRIEALSRFEIQATRLEHDVTAKNWFMHEMLARGYSLEGLKEISDQRIEALYVVVERDTAYVVRAAVIINGPRMIVASYYVPEAFWMKERAYQQYAIESFNFMTPETTRVETTRKHSFLDLLSFEYPSSWRLIAPAVYSVAGMEAKLINSSDQITSAGEIQISVISNEDPQALRDEIDYQKDLMKQRGLQFGDTIEARDDYEYSDHIIGAIVECYELFDKENKVGSYEYWLGVMEEDRYYYVVTLVTPSRGGDFYTWARNEEAYKIVVESFEP